LRLLAALLISAAVQVRADQASATNRKGVIDMIRKFTAAGLAALALAGIAGPAAALAASSPATPAARATTTERSSSDKLASERRSNDKLARADSSRDSHSSDISRDANDT
jgi:hypothetical protein